MIDARFTGHEFHEELNYSISYPSIGDCLDRYIPRFNEIIESCRIIYGLLVILLSAYFYSTFTGFSIIMELLIEEFLIHFPLILSLILQSKLSIESSKGIYSIYLFPFPVASITTIEFLKGYYEPNRNHLIWVSIITLVFPLSLPYLIVSLDNSGSDMYHFMAPLYCALASLLYSLPYALYYYAKKINKKKKILK